MRSSIIAKVGVAIAAMFAATSGLAVANALPAPVQDVTSHLGIGAPAHHHDTASTAGDETTTTIEETTTTVESPTTTEPDETKPPAAPAPTTEVHDNHGSEVSTVAHDHSVTGCEHGAAVSKVASDGRSHNDGSCDSKEPETPEDHRGDDNQGDKHKTDGHGHDGTSPTTVDDGSSESSGGGHGGGSDSGS